MALKRKRPTTSITTTTTPKRAKSSLVTPARLHLHELSLQGVRSYSPEGTAQTIQFSSPLTLIVGSNGSGKTTLVEALRFVTTGELPPCNERKPYWLRAFMHRCAVTKTHNKHQQAQVELSLVDDHGHMLRVRRQLKMDTHTLKCKVTRNTVALLDGQQRTLWQDGERTMTTQDLNAFISGYTGLSTSVLTNVLFVHQKEMEWPLGSARELKRHIDVVFGTERHTRANDALNRTRNAYDKARKDAEHLLEVLTQVTTEKKSIVAEKTRAETEKAKCDATMKTAKSKCTAQEQRVAEAESEYEAARDQWHHAKSAQPLQRQSKIHWERYTHLAQEYDALASAWPDLETAVQRACATRDHHRSSSRSQHDVATLDAVVAWKEKDEALALKVTQARDEQRKAEHAAEDAQKTWKDAKRSLQRVMLISRLRMWHTTWQESRDGAGGGQDASWTKFDGDNDQAKTRLVRTISKRQAQAHTDYTKQKQVHATAQHHLRQAQDTVIASQTALAHQCQVGKKEYRALLNPTPSQAKERVAEYQKEVNTVLAQKHSVDYWTYAHQEMQKKGTCPTCSQTVTTIPSRPESMCHDRAALKQQLNQARNRLAQHEADVKRHEALEAQQKCVKDAETTLKRHQHTLDQCKTVEAEEQQRLDMCAAVKTRVDLLKRVVDWSDFQLLFDATPNEDNNGVHCEDDVALERHLTQCYDHYKAQLEQTKDDAETQRVKEVYRNATQTHDQCQAKVRACIQAYSRLEDQRQSARAMITHEIRQAYATLTLPQIQAERRQARQCEKDHEQVTTAQQALHVCETRIRRLQHDVHALYDAVMAMCNDDDEDDTTKTNLKDDNMADGGGMDCLNTLRPRLDAVRDHLKPMQHQAQPDVALSRRLDAAKKTLSQAREALRQEERVYHETAGQVQNWVEHAARAQAQLQAERFHGIDARYRDAQTHASQLRQIVTELEAYYKARDRMLTQYHHEKMAQVNRILHDIWSRMYQGDDIESIRVKSECKLERNKRVYNYHVVMVQRGLELSMASHASKGQGVLACVVIRLALARAFCQRADMMVLDEPTVNLDAEHIHMLANVLRRWMDTGFESGFQLVVITHNERFAQALASDSHVHSYVHVSKQMDANGRVYSTLKTHPIRALTAQFEHDVMSFSLRARVYRLLDNFDSKSQQTLKKDLTKLFTVHTIAVPLQRPCHIPHIQVKSFEDALKSFVTNATPDDKKQVQQHLAYMENYIATTLEKQNRNCFVKKDDHE